MPVVEISSWDASAAYLADPSIIRPINDGISKADGCQAIYSGIAHEDGKRFHSIIVWETLEKHQALVNQPSFSELLKLSESVRNGEGQTYHVNFNKEFTPALTAPTTEILRMTLLEGKTKEDLENILNIIASRIDVGNSKFAPVTWGPTLEDMNKFYLTIGWETVKAHVDFVTDPGFSPLIDTLREIVGLEMFHSSLTRNA